jgi:hypothetical protein
VQERKDEEEERKWREREKSERQKGKINKEGKYEKMK